MNLLEGQTPSASSPQLEVVGPSSISDSVLEATIEGRNAISSSPGATDSNPKTFYKCDEKVKVRSLEPAPVTSDETETALKLISTSQIDRVESADESPVPEITNFPNDNQSDTSSKSEKEVDFEIPDNADDGPLGADKKFTTFKSRFLALSNLSFTNRIASSFSSKSLLGRRMSFSSKYRSGGEHSILVTSEKRAIRAAQKAKGKQPRQHLKKVHFRLPKSAHKRRTVQSLNPNMQFVQRWLMFMVLPLSYEMWAFPYRLALGFPCTDPAVKSGTFVPDAVCDAAFAVDMLISLITAIPIAGSDELVTSFRSIADHYFRRVFPAQILPSVAFWAITAVCADNFDRLCPPQADGEADLRCIVEVEHWSLWLWWAATVPRVIPRFLRLKAYFKSMEMNLVTPALTRPGPIIFPRSHFFALSAPSA